MRHDRATGDAGTGLHVDEDVPVDATPLEPVRRKFGDLIVPSRVIDTRREDHVARALLQHLLEGLLWQMERERRETALMAANFNAIQPYPCEIIHAVKM